MDKESILAAARSDTYRGQEYERKESVRSNLLSSAIALIVAGILLIIEFWATKRWNLSLIIIILIFAGVDSLYEGIRFKKGRTITIGTIQLLGAVFFTLLFVCQVVAA